jgi:tRNA threonylcarbamoyladenosine biosynthesis protein TsaE
MSIKITDNAEATYKLGYKLGQTCRGGEIFLLCGDLGAGKTKLTQGLAAGLGVKGRVNSPTFNILKIYRAAGPVKSFCHVDAYRLRSAEDLVSLGIVEFLADQTAVTVIEWAEKVSDLWPAQARVIKIEALSETKRRITY